MLGLPFSSRTTQFGNTPRVDCTAASYARRAAGRQYAMVAATRNETRPTSEPRREGLRPAFLRRRQAARRLPPRSAEAYRTPLERDSSRRARTGRRSVAETVTGAQRRWPAPRRRGSDHDGRRHRRRTASTDIDEGTANLTGGPRELGRTGAVSRRAAWRAPEAARAARRAKKMWVTVASIRALDDVGRARRHDRLIVAPGY